MKHKNSFQILILHFLLILCWTTGKTQDTLSVYADHTQKGLLIYWEYEDPDLWASMISVGFKVERENLESGKNVVISNKILPQERAWFFGTEEFSFPLFRMMGCLLYESDFFTFQNESLSAANRLRYDYLLTEIQNDHKMAPDLGMGILDEEVKKNTPYLYTISSLDKQLSKTFMLEYAPDSLSTDPDFERRAFSLPLKESLSNWVERIENEAAPEVISVSRTFGDRIELQWYPNDYRLWIRGKDKGYQIEKQDMFGKENSLGNIKAATRQGIETLGELNPVVKLANAILFGRYDTKNADLNALRFRLALFAAEQSSLAAEVLGWKLDDFEVEPDSYYTYTIAAPKLEDSPLDISTSVTVQNLNPFQFNLAGFQAVLASTLADNSVPASVVDGMTDGNFSNSPGLQTEAAGGSWVTIDLGEVQPIQAIRIYNRTDCCQDNLGKYYLMIGDNQFSYSTNVNEALKQATWSTGPRNDNNKEVINVELPANVAGRFVRLQLAQDYQNALHIAEIEVAGVPAN